MTAPRPGQRVADLFGAYQKLPAGPRKRAMASKILVANEALIQATVDCLCGRKPLVGLRRPFKGCEGFDKLEIEDAMQAGRIAFAKAIDQYQPERGKFPYYLLMKTRNELHNIETWGHHLLHVPEAHVPAMRPVRQVHLFGAFRELQSGDDDETIREGGLRDLSLTTDGDLVDTDEFTPEDVRGWAETGEWPEDLETWQATKAKADDVDVAEPEPPPDSRTALEKFLDEHVKFRTQARTARRPFFNRWSFFAESEGSAADDIALTCELQRHGVRRMTVRVPWNPLPVPGLAGVELLQSA